VAIRLQKPFLQPFGSVSLTAGPSFMRIAPQKRNRSAISARKVLSYVRKDSFGGVWLFSGNVARVEHTEEAKSRRKIELLLNEKTGPPKLQAARLNFPVEKNYAVACAGCATSCSALAKTSRA
jgi:hypothetical protein